MKSFVLIALLLLTCGKTYSQEFAVVGEWANRDACQQWWGFVPTPAQWAQIDAINCNWLKIVLYELNTINEDATILSHQPATGNTRYIVDRQRSPTDPHAYWECAVHSGRSGARTLFLGRYIMSSLAIRLQPESEFDYDSFDGAHGHRYTETGAEKSPYVEQQPTYNVTRSQVGPQTPGIIVSEAADNTRPGGSELANASRQDFHYLVIRARLAAAPSTVQDVYAAHLRYWDGAAWQTFHTQVIRSDDFAAPVDQFQELAYPLPTWTSEPTGVTRPYAKDITIEWLGNVTASVDWVEVCSQCSYDILHEQNPVVVENDIRQSIHWYADPGLDAVRNNIGKLFSTDEAIWPELLNLRCINNLIQDELGGAVPGYAYYLDRQGQHRWGYYRLALIDEMAGTGWMFGSDASGPIIDDGSSTATFLRMHWATEGWRVLAETVQRGGIAGKVFWPVIQTNAHGPGPNQNGELRMPYHEEVKAAIGLGLSYGAKGVVYHIIWGQTNCDRYEGLLGTCSPEYQSYRDITRDTVSVLNLRLRGTLGDRLMHMSWDGTYDGGFTGPAYPEAMELNGIVLQNTGNAQCASLETHPPGGANDAVAYVQLADFQDDAGSDYLFLVNKRTQVNHGGDRIMDLEFTNASSLFFQDIESHAIDVIPVNGTKSTLLPAGDFCLLRAADNTLTTPLTVDNVMYVRANAEYTIASTLTVVNGATIHIENGATLTIATGGSIILNGGTISCEGNGTLRIMEPQGLQGTGTITLPNLCLGGEWVIPGGTQITLRDGGSISFQCAVPGSENRITVLGELQFRGSGCVFTFEGDITEVNIGGTGVLDAMGAFNIEGVPHVNNWNQGRFVVHGDGDDHRCTLVMRDHAEINDNATLDIAYATLTSADPQEWDGIMIIGNESLCRLRYVDILRIFCDPVDQGTGVHFYEAPNPENLISHCNITRTGKADNLGDGIFLQPGGSGSYAEIECTSTGDDWWTGVTTVSSSIDVTGLNASGNLRGIGAHLSGTLVNLVQSVLDFNTFEGVYAQGAAIYLGEYEAGYNEIYHNEEVQIDLTQSSRIYHNGSQHGINNDIGHTWVQIPCVRADATSRATLPDNYWMDPVPVQSMFVEALPNSIIWNPYLTQSLRGSFHGWACEQILIKRSTPRITAAPTSASLKNFALAGRMSEVYSYLDTLFYHAASGATQIEVLRDLLVMEVLHLRMYPDSTSASRSRFMQYLANRRPMIATQHAADMLALQAVYFTFAGYQDSAEVAFDQLARNFRQSDVYQHTLHVKVLNGFIQHDSIAIDDVIGEMLAAAIDTGIVRLVRSERRAYYRCMKVGMLPKRIRHEQKVVPAPATIEMQVHPNPWRTSTLVTISIPEDMAIHVRLLSSDGREVRTLWDGAVRQGSLELILERDFLPTGVYFCTVVSRRYRGLARLVILP